MSRPTLVLPDRLLTAVEAAGLLGVSVATIRKWSYERRLPVVHVNGRAARYRQSVLLKLIDQWTQPAMRPLGDRN